MQVWSLLPESSAVSFAGFTTTDNSGPQLQREVDSILAESDFERKKLAGPLSLANVVVDYDGKITGERLAPIDWHRVIALTLSKYRNHSELRGIRYRESFKHRNLDLQTWQPWTKFITPDSQSDRQTNGQVNRRIRDEFLTFTLIPTLLSLHVMNRTPTKFITSNSCEYIPAFHQGLANKVFQP